MIDSIELIKRRLNELKNSKLSEINHFQYSHKSKLPVKIQTFNETLNFRVIDFSEAALQLLINEFHIPSIALIRSLYESNAVIFRLNKLVEQFLNSDISANDFNDSIEKILFANRLGYMVEATNVLTFIDQLDNKGYNGLRNFYDLTSEFVHPNWHGTAGSYSELIEANNITKIKKIYADDEKFLSWIYSIFLLNINIHKDFYSKIKKNLPLIVRFV